MGYTARIDLRDAKHDVPKHIGYAVMLTDNRNGKVYYLGRDNRTNSSFDTGYPTLYEEVPDIFSAVKDAKAEWIADSKNFYSENKTIVENSTVRIIEVSVSMHIMETFKNTRDIELSKMRDELAELDKQREALKKRIEEKQR